MTKRVGVKKRSSGRSISTTITAGLTAMLLFASADLHAQGGGLFLPAETPGAADPAPGVTVLRSRVVRIDFGALAVARMDAEPETTSPTLTLNLFDDVVFSGIVERTAPTLSGGYVLWGRLDGVELGTFTLVVNGEVVAGTVLTPQATYRIRSAGGRLHAIRQIDSSTLPPGGEPLIPPPPAADAPDTFALTAADDDGSVIDVAVFYTPAARRAVGGTAEIEALIDLMIAETNQAYDDSGVIQRVRLVWRDAVDYSEAPTSSDDVRALTYLRDGAMDGIHAIRDREGADLVHLILNRSHGGDRDVCGRAWRMVNVSTGFEDFRLRHHRLSLRRAARSRTSWATTWGSTMTDTSWRTEGLLDYTSYPYSFGYVNQRAFERGAPFSSRWNTIMAYPDQCIDAWVFTSCAWLLRFSNPDQSYNGDPLGVPGDHVSASVTGPSDARRALNNTRTTVANFRPAGGCRYTLAPLTHYVLPPGGGPFEVAVDTTGSTCSWTASSTVAFLRLTGATTGTGNGTVRYEVLEHTAPQPAWAPSRSRAQRPP